MNKYVWKKKEDMPNFMHVGHSIQALFLGNEYFANVGCWFGFGSLFYKRDKSIIYF